MKSLGISKYAIKMWLPKAKCVYLHYTLLCVCFVYREHIQKQWRETKEEKVGGIFEDERQQRTRTADGR